MSQSKKLIGVIGGSGVYEMAELVDVREERIETPFGDPSDVYVVGRLGSQPVAFLPRHGRGHRILPSELNFRANIHGFKALGADAILSISAVGSLREHIAPGSVVIPDQFIDRTRGRVSTFFGDGVVAHVAFADPFCPSLRATMAAAAGEAGGTVHDGGTYVCMEGPQFSTRAESSLYRDWGGDVVGMTNLQEAKLAREAELCFTALAMATDYDCWRSAEADVAIEDILAVLAANSELAKKAVSIVAESIDHERTCTCRNALDNAIITDPACIPDKRRAELSVVAGRVLEGDQTS